jgi:hypothetical protein
MKLAIFIAILLFPLQSIAGDVVEWPDCYCTDKAGSRVELGENICLTVDGRSYTARCEMSLNVPMWREVGPECLSSFNRDPKSPFPLQSTPTIGAKIAMTQH